MKYKQDNSGDSHDAQAKIERQYLGLDQSIDVANMIAFNSRMMLPE